MRLSKRETYGETLIEIAKSDKRIIVLDADAGQATKSILFKEKYPERFFDMGIAEQDMVGTAAGLAIAGFIPFVSTFAVFLSGRAYEQIRNSVAYPGLNVKLYLSHSGITTGGDGATHQTFEDISLMRGIPGMKVIVPADEIELKQAIYESVKTNGPVCIRGTRYSSPVIYDGDYSFKIGKASVLKEGKDVCIIANGVMVHRALEAAKILEEKGISAAVINMSTVKPLDDNILLEYAKKTKRIVTVEEHSIIGGLGSAVLECLSDKYCVPVKRIGINDVFGQSGEADEMLEAYGLMSENIEKTVISFLNDKNNA
jgi:transketolase